MPGNGNGRFEDLKQRVEKIDDKLDAHGEQLARIETLIEGQQCTKHGEAIDALDRRTLQLENGAQVSIAKLAGLSGVIAAVVSAIGAYFTARGGQ